MRSERLRNGFNFHPMHARTACHRGDFAVLVLRGRVAFAPMANGYRFLLLPSYFSFLSRSVPLRHRKDSPLVLDVAKYSSPSHPPCVENVDFILFRLPSPGSSPPCLSVQLRLSDRSRFKSIFFIVHDAFLPLRSSNKAVPSDHQYLLAFISTRLVFFGVIFRLIPLFAHFTFVSRERSLLLTFILPPLPP